jgi:hypothetical protein
VELKDTYRDVIPTVTFFDLHIANFLEPVAYEQVIERLYSEFRKLNLASEQTSLTGRYLDNFISTLKGSNKDCC